MTQCPHCQNLLTDTDLFAGQCSACGKTLAASGNDPKATIQETGNSPNIGQTLDSAAFAGMNWADKPETPAGSTGQQPPSPLQGNDSKKTIQETGNSPSIGQTLDAAAMAGMNWADKPETPAGSTGQQPPS
ncbi:MAG: hypothetical protein AB7I37_21575, partial [Pirellulales bacterium]